MSHMLESDIAPTTTATSHVPEPYLSVEKLDCYRVASEFQALIARIAVKGNRELRDQLNRDGRPWEAPDAER